MRLLEAHVENFGVLHQFHISFERDMNVICAPNGSGKTTLAAFLQAMFYGMPPARRELTDNPRKKYQPWQGGTFGGWIEVETDHRTLRIARTFGPRPKEDTLQLTEALTGRSVEIPEEGIGQMLFGLDESAYARTVFLPRRGVTGSGDGLHDSLRAMLEGERSPAAYTDALRRLETARKVLQPLRGTGGRIGQLEQELADVGAQWTRASVEARAQEEYAQQCDELQHKLEEARTHRAECAAALAEAHRAAGGQEELRRQLTEAEAFFPGGVPTEEDLAAAESALRNLEAQRGTLPGEQECELARDYARQARESQEALGTLVLPPEVYQRGKELERYFGGAAPSMSTIGQWEKQAELLLKYKSRRLIWSLVAALLATMAVFSAVVAVDQLLRQQTLGGWLMLLAVLLLGGAGLSLAAALRPRAKIQFLNRLLKPIQEQYNPDLLPEDAALEVVEFREEWEQIKTQVRSLKEARARQSELRSEALAALDTFFKTYGRPDGTPEQAIAALCMQASPTWNHKPGEDRAFLQGFWSRYSPDPNPAQPRRALQEIRSVWDRIRHLRTALDGCSDIGAVETCRKQLQEADDRSAQLEEKVRQAERRLEDARNAQRTAAELLDRHNTVRAQLTEAEHKRDLLDRTIQWMQEAQDQLSVQYLAPIRTGFLEYFRRMFDASAGNLTVDPDLKIVWTRDGGERPISCFSDGTQTAAEVCLRLAMIDLLFCKERPMLILDDPFVYLDDHRLIRAMQMLSSLAQDTQILYFTCHTSRREDEDDLL